MAIFSLTMKPHSRRKLDSVIRLIACTAAEKLYDQRLKKFFSYDDDSKIIAKGLIFPVDIASSDESFDTFSREKLWNLAECCDSGKVSRIVREIIVNVPFELNADQQRQLVVAFASSLANYYDIAIDFVLRSPPIGADPRSFRAHLFLTTRCIKINKNGELEFSRKSYFEWSNKNLTALNLPTTHDQLKQIRARWAALINVFLARYKIHAYVDSRSHQARQLSVRPFVNLSAIDRQLENCGIPTLLGNYNRQVENENARIMEQRAISERTFSQTLSEESALMETVFATINEAQYRIKKYNKFTQRSNKTDQFIEKYYQQTAATDRSIERYLQKIDRRKRAIS